MGHATTGTYKGAPVISLHRGDEDDRYPFTFGVKKAMLILEHIEEIRAFVRDHSQTEDE